MSDETREDVAPANAAGATESPREPEPERETEPDPEREPEPRPDEATEEPGEKAGALQPVEAAGLTPAGDEADPGPADSDDEKADLPALLEALLFASGKPVPVEKLAEVTELAPERIEEGLAALEVVLGAPGRGVRLDRVAGGVRIVSRPAFDYPIRRLLGLDGRTKLSMAALETLAIVAYRQPITAPEVAELRGVGSSSSIRTLLDRKLITTAGRKEVVGTPFLYKTTKEFLVHFGLVGIEELPKLEELDALYGVEAQGGPSAEQGELFPSEDVETTATGDAEASPLAGEAPGAPASDAAPGDGATVPASECSESSESSESSVAPVGPVHVEALAEPAEPALVVEASGTASPDAEEG